MDILVSFRLRSSPILKHLQKAYRFEGITADFVPSLGIRMHYAETRTADMDLPRLYQITGSSDKDRDSKTIDIILVHVYPGSEDVVSAYAELAAKLLFNILPCWSHAQAAYIVQESQRFSQRPERLLHTGGRYKDNASHIVRMLQAMGLNKPKIRALCGRFSTLQDICNASVHDIAVLSDFSEETAAAFLKALGSPHAPSPSH